MDRSCNLSPLPPPPPPLSFQDLPPLPNLLTIVVTTSPIKSNPSTEVLEKTFETFLLCGEEFCYQCPKVVVCDGCRVLEEEKERVVGDDDDDENQERVVGNDDDDENQKKSHESDYNKDKEGEEKIANSKEKKLHESNQNPTNTKQNQQQEREEKTTQNKKKITRKHANVKQALRSGIVTEDQLENYQKFKENLRKICQKAKLDRSNEGRWSPFCNTEVMNFFDNLLFSLEKKLFL